MSTVQRCVRRIKVPATGSAALIQRCGRTCTAAVHDNIRRTERQICRNSRKTDKLCSNLSIGKGVIWGRMGWGGGERPLPNFFFTCV